MLDAVRLPEGYFDRVHFMYYEDMDLGWRARLAAWSARYVPDSVVLHKWTGSSRRHGKSWLAVLLGTNRIRTLLKNASPWFLARTSLRTLLEIGVLAWHGGFRALANLVRAVRQSLAQRPSVTKMAKVDRRAIERAWTAARL
jgi:GT2 family glycosyltransferase